MLDSFRRSQLRYSRRLARIARWNRPIAGRVDRLKAWVNMVLADHGVFRLVYLNHHRLSDKLWRSAQPAPHQFALFSRQGVRTVINLRNGRAHGSWQLQREACERLGLNVVDFIVRSRVAPEPAVILAAKQLFDTIEYPAVLHCKSGADRAGFVAALYVLLHEGRPAREALRQLSLRYGHFRFARTGILDAFFERYLAEGESRGLSFIDWVDRVYDPQALERDFRPGFWSELIADKVMRRE